jgi:hypothetical protein
MGQHTPLATLRRDVNEEYVALARLTQKNFLEDRQAIVAMLEEMNRFREREVILACGVGLSLVCTALMATSLFLK